tara:strand:- start:2656 stop:2943 length:288 start_codon:yes stop_codon:yes gene_type:complete
LAIVKSEIIDILSDNYPGFLKKDLIKVSEIILSRIENSLNNQERIELRDIFTLESKVQKERISRNPKTNEQVKVPEKITIQFKMSKKWLQDLNEK